MARRGMNKKLIVSIVIGGMIVFVGGSIGLLTLWGRRDPSIYVDRAVEACRASNMAVALGAYQQAYRSTLNPEWIVQSAFVAKEFGDAARALNLYDKAIAARAGLLSAHRGRVELRLELARLHPTTEALVNLRKDAEALLELQPQDPRALLAKSVALDGLRHEDPKHAEESLEAVEQARKAAPKDPDIAETLARHYERLDAATEPDGPSRAEQVFEELLRDDPNSVDARIRYAEFLMHRLRDRAEQASSRGVSRKPREEEATLKRVEELLQEAADPGHAKEDLALAWARYWSLAGKPKKSIEALSTGLARHPDNLRIHAELAGKLLRSGQTEQARTVAQQGLARPFDRESYRGMLNLPYRHRLLCTIAQTYLAEIARDPSRRKDLIAKADEARKQADLEAGADHWRGRMVLGQIRRAQGRPLPAVNCYVQADRMLSWETQSDEKLTARLALVHAHMQVESYGPAEEALTELLEHRPGEPQALALRSKLYLTIGRISEAAGDAEAAVRSFAERRRAEGAAARSGPTSLLSSRGRDPARLAQLVWWSASAIEGGVTDAQRARERLGTLTAADQLFFARALRHSDPSRRKERLLDQAEEAYLKAVELDPSKAEAVRELVVLYAERNRATRSLPLVTQTLQALKQEASKNSAQTGAAAAELEAIRIALDSTLPEPRRKAKIRPALAAIKDPLSRAKRLARHHLDAREPQKALEALARVAAKHPEDVELLEMRFDAALAAKDWTTAESLRRRAVNLNADGAGGRTYEGRLLLGRGLALRAASRAEDGDIGHRRTEEIASQFGAAVDALRAGADEVNYWSMARVWLGRALQALGEAEARDAYQMALVLNPINAEAHKRLAQLLRGDALVAAPEETQARHVTQAIRLARKGLDGFPVDPWLHARAEERYEQAHPEQSIQRREALRKQNPEDIENLLRLATLYDRLDKDKERDACLRRVLEIAPKDLDTHVRVAEQYASAGRYDRAREVLEAFVRPAQGEAKAEALLALARQLQKQYVGIQSTSAAPTALRKLRDRADEVFEQAAQIETTPVLCQAAADFCLLTQRRPKAVEWLRRALRSKQNGLDEKPIREKLIRTLLSMRPLPEGVEREVADYDARYQGWEEVSLFWGLLQGAKGELDKAVDQHTRYIERLLAARRSSFRRPEELAEAYALRGKLYLRIGTLYPDRRAEAFRRAIEDLTRAKADASRADTKVEYGIALAEALQRSQQTDSALLELRGLVEAYPEHSEAAGALIEMLGNAGKYTEQEAEIRKQMQREPNHWRWPHRLGTVMERRGYASEAEAAYRRAVELCDYGAGGVGNMAVVDLLRTYAKQNKLGEIIKITENKIARQDRDYRVSTYYGAALARAGRTADALKAWTRATEAVISVQEQHSIARAIQLLLGKDNAMAAVRQILKQTNRSPRARFLHSVLCEMNGQHAQAIQELEDLKDTAKKPEDRVEILAYLGTLKLLEKKGEEAADLFRAALRIDRDHQLSLNNLAIVLSDQLDKPEEALKYARRAAELSPDAPRVIDTLGWCLTLTGEYEAAATILEEAASKYPLVQIYYHLAETYRRMERSDPARRFAQAGLELAKRSKNKEYQKKLEAVLQGLSSGS